MTIFLMVLQKFIKEELSTISTNLKNQTEGIINRNTYNQELSLKQKEIIGNLEDEIARFSCTKDDKADSESIAKLIETTRDKIQKARESHGVPRDEGATINCLNNLVFNTKSFYTKLDELKFKLLDTPYSESPEVIVYYYAACYFGQELFNPKKNLNVEIRIKKEEKVQNRLILLNKLIKKDHTFEEREEWTFQVLKDLSSDNKEVVKKEKISTIGIPGLSFFGFGLNLPVDIFGPGEGRLGEQFNLAARKISEIKQSKLKVNIENKTEEKEEEKEDNLGNNNEEWGDNLSMNFNKE